MKKIEKVSIADISFALDSDAYLSLTQYLDSLHASYDDDPDGGEIIADIEARIAELILGEQVYTKVVSKSLIDRIIAQLGNPKDFDDQDDEQIAAERILQAEPTIPRRLHRSCKGRILGGVCRGMAQFWDINVAWVRLVFLSPLIVAIIQMPFDLWYQIDNLVVGCMWVLAVLYVVLWMSLPVAKTPRQKLEARGERITPSSIRQNLQQNAKSPSAKKAASVMAEILAVIGHIVLFFVKFIVAAIGCFFMLAAVGILVAMFIIPFDPTGMLINNIDGVHIYSVFEGMSILSPLWFAELILLCMLIPLFVIGTGLLILLFNWKIGRLFFGITLGVWILAMMFCLIVFIGNVRYFRNQIHNRGDVIEWVDDRNDCDNDVYDFIEEEDNGLNNITINIAPDSVEVVSWRVSPGGAKNYNRRMVIKNAKVKEGGRVEIRRKD